MFCTRLLQLKQSWMKVLPTRIRNTFNKNPRKFIEKTFVFQKQIPTSKFYSRNVECSYDNSAEMLPAETQFRSLNFRKFKHKILPGKHVFWNVSLDTMEAPLTKLTYFFERVWNCFAEKRKLFFDCFSRKFNFILTPFCPDKQTALGTFLLKFFCWRIVFFRS